ncbi:hypothetical protein LCGC14_0903170 [marine sediment metagenome]|uniref:Uncharacterized protein n=1 Tax=marine sediment metagenome TaxID=412755 RepID=A0A0F9NVS6_9ZZZZ
MRVGANAKQHARIKKLHAAGMDPATIAASIPMTAQSLEHILAHLDGREEVALEVDDNPAVQALRGENADLLARLAKYEEVGRGAQEDAPKADEPKADEPKADETVRTEGEEAGQAQARAKAE